MQTHKIMICEDHDLITDGLRVLISMHPQFVVVGRAKKWDDLRPLLQENAPHILILDLNLGQEDGFSILSKVRREYAHLRVLILTMYDDVSMIEKAKQLKANGYLLKNASSQELVTALNAVLQNGFYENPKIYLERANISKKREAFVEKMKLTRREVEIVTLVAKGKNPEQISRDLYLSLHTVRTHKKNILKKLGLANTADLVRFAFVNMLTD